MNIPEFSVNGIYVRVVNCQNEIKDYNPSILERFSKTSSTNKWDRDHPVYEIVCFMQVGFDKKDPEFKGGYFFGMTGEIQNIADYYMSSGYTKGTFGNIEFHGKTFSMENNEMKINGILRPDYFHIMEIDIENKITGEIKSGHYRFVQWLPKNY